ncbi:uncharacterized protein LOC132751867 [Ruditapes philippinarum]|uniref:uncharacterized protein LOC132751867 n=1 Tax=Ruditapes philippinarum TaxID=129788 RepID=UPI00295AB926|nr:uncharacterized protein LOC132751867 [Ruditapes philippinarum]
MKLNLGDKIKTKTSPEDDVILIQYEALIPEERSEGFAEVGHSHMYAVRVCTENGTYFEFKHVEVAARSLPILFRTLEKFPARQGDVIREMYINAESSEKKKFLY